MGITVHLITCQISEKKSTCAKLDARVAFALQLLRCSESLLLYVYLFFKCVMHINIRLCGCFYSVAMQLLEYFCGN